MNSHPAVLRRSVAAVALLTAVLALPACRAKEKKAEQQADKPAAAELIAAEDFRQEITTIDRLVFSDFMDDRYRMMLVGNLAALAGRLDVPARSIPVRQRVAKLRELANAVQDDANPMLLGDIQGAWRSIRSNLFGERDWFSNSVQDAMRWPGDAREAGEGVPQTAQGGGTYAPAPPRFQLPGRWAVAEAVVNGSPSADPNEAGALWTFDADGLTIDKGAIAGRYSFIDYIDSRGPALRVESIDGTLGGWILYQFTPNGKLVVAFNSDLNERPEGFAVAAPALPPADAAGDGGAGVPAEPQQTPAAGAAQDGKGQAAQAPAAPAPQGATIIAPDAGMTHYMLTLDPVQ